MLFFEAILASINIWRSMARLIVLSVGDVSAAGGRTIDLISVPFIHSLSFSPFFLFCHCPEATPPLFRLYTASHSTFCFLPVGSASTSCISHGPTFFFPLPCIRCRCLLQKSDTTLEDVALVRRILYTSRHTVASTVHSAPPGLSLPSVGFLFSQSLYRIRIPLHVIRFRREDLQSLCFFFFCEVFLLLFFLRYSILL